MGLPPWQLGAGGVWPTVSVAVAGRGTGTLTCAALIFGAECEHGGVPHSSTGVQGGGGGWHKASVSDCLPLAVPVGLSPLLILTLCGPEHVLVVSKEPPDDLSCLTTPGVGRPGDGLLPVPLTRCLQMHPLSPCGGFWGGRGGGGACAAFVGGVGGGVAVGGGGGDAAFVGNIIWRAVGIVADSRRTGGGGVSGLTGKLPIIVHH